MTSNQKRAFWQQHIHEWRQSKLPQKAYCQQHNISCASVGDWLARLKRLHSMVPMTLTRPLIVVMRLPMGVRIEVPVDMCKSINGLPILVKQEMDLVPNMAALFVFCNRGRDKTKLVAGWL